MHWIQQGSVDHFATDNSRENEFGPWTGFVIAHLFLFGTGDYLVHLPQWSAMVLSALLASFMVDSFSKRWNFPAGPENTTRRNQDAGALAGLLVLTIPIGMMESMSPQTDFVATFWLLAIILFGLDFLSTPTSPGRMAICGIVFGLGLLTKSTILMYSAPFLLAGALMFAVRPVAMGVKVRLALLFAACVLTLNAGHSLRNYTLFGSPLGSTFVKEMVTNERISPAVFVSNLIRNLLLHANCGIPSLTRALNNAVTRFHESAGMKMDDPATTLLLGPLELPEKLLVYDDYASAPLHVLWIGLGLLLALRWPRRNARVFGYVALVLASAALFVATLKFQIYHSRFHLAYLALLLPVAALVLTGHLRRWLLALVPVSVVVYAAICVRVNEARPIFDPAFTALPREAQYLSKQKPTWTPALQKIADEVAASGPQCIGLKFGFNGFEYPFWVMLRNRSADAIVKHAFVEGVPESLEARTPSPTVIVTFRRPVSQETVEIYPYRTTHPPLMALWKNQPKTPPDSR
jgi:4-amino-4-deoxy-L-arabinose transferase-like glycosyltransferase